MQPDRLSDEQLDQLAAELAPRLPTGTHGDRVILPRRQFVAALGGTLGAGALMALGVDEATAQAAGQQGTAEEPNDMFAWDLDVQNGATFNGTDVEGVGSLSAEKSRLVGEDHLDIMVPSDYPTVSDAIDFAKTVGLKSGRRVDITIQEGHEIIEPIELEDEDHRQTRIYADSEPVLVSDDYPFEHLITAINSWLPTLHCVIDMQDNGRSGIHASLGCIGRVAETKGIINAGLHGIEARSGVYGLKGTEWSGAFRRGIMATTGATVQAEDVVAEDCGQNGLFVSRDASISAQDGVFSGADEHGIRVGKATANIDYAVANDCGENGLWAWESHVFGSNMEIKNSGDEAVLVEQGSRAALANATIENAERCVHVLDGSSVDLHESELSDAGSRAVRVEDGSSVNLQDVSFTNVASDALMMWNGSLANVNGSTVDGSEFDEDDVSRINNLNEVDSDGIVFG